MSTPLLILENVKTHFPVWHGLVLRKQVGTIRAVDGVSLSIGAGEIVGLVGESGCGKSTLARTILRLAPLTEGRILFDGRALGELSAAELRLERVNLQMVFQDPFASLNPRMTVFDTLAEAVRRRRPLRGAELAAHVGELMERVGLGAGAAGKYPHEFSGGQRQRIAIARALATEPRLILADEPVSALDVSIQSQIINLILELSRALGLTLLFISHDLSVVKYIADRVAVMYLGRLVEVGAAAAVIERPLHPYTRALVSAVHIPDPERERQRRRIVLQGDPPSPLNPPSGCTFHPRCPFAASECSAQVPQLEERGDGRRAACLRLDALPPG
ncbi:MAG: peptide ABC transporter substrate-binding protein [Lentisphaerae bacterium RIFOXYB12_FULL_65_16]|nr:MAG: peptide ABC transporter substrate-binding protein [Lentisphaerae bacterium RIFOXYA12_64_32]OGV85902.1 MAG: peptide ABC transporter substrate-binding protein [Lentisphaerae bacterium RIFOXYB12_FULL_65_16]